MAIGVDMDIISDLNIAGGVSLLVPIYVSLSFNMYLVSYSVTLDHWYIEFIVNFENFVPLTFYSLPVLH